MSLNFEKDIFASKVENFKNKSASSVLDWSILEGEDPLLLEPKAEKVDPDLEKKRSENIKTAKERVLEIYDKQKY